MTSDLSFINWGFAPPQDKYILISADSEYGGLYINNPIYGSLSDLIKIMKKSFIDIMNNYVLDYIYDDAAAGLREGAFTARKKIIDFLDQPIKTIEEKINEPFRAGFSGYDWDLHCSFNMISNQGSLRFYASDTYEETHGYAATIIKV